MNKLTSMAAAIAALGLVTGQAAFAAETTVEAQAIESQNRVADQIDALLPEQERLQVRSRTRTRQESPASHYGMGYEARQGLATQSGPGYGFGNGPGDGSGAGGGNGGGSNGGGGGNGGNGAR